MMQLQQIKAYIKQRHIVSLFDLKREFGTDAEVLRDMLNLWIQKGHLRCMQKTPSCGTRCTNCDPLFTEMYEWIAPRNASEKVIHFQR